MNLINDYSLYINFQSTNSVTFAYQMNAFRAISSALLALLVLISSTSITVGMHLCMDEIQNVALFAKAEGCEKEQSLPPCHSRETAPCCADETLVHQADDLSSSITHFNLVSNVPLHLEQPLLLISELIPSSAVAQTHYIHYDSPLRSWDLTVRNQVFLI